MATSTVCIKAANPLTNHPEHTTDMKKEELPDKKPPTEKKALWVVPFPFPLNLGMINLSLARAFQQLTRAVLSDHPL
jgi:hypothetical protein